MLFRFAAIALLATPLHAAPARHTVPKPVAKVEPAPPPLQDVEKVAITTELGVITLELDGKHAPISTANFLHYVDTKRYDGIVFYRSMHLEWGDPPNGLVQAGVRDARALFPPIAHEPTSQTGVLHKAGTISLARLAVGTARADFSILLSDLEGLDADPTSADPELQAGYAAFGHVTQGMDVVRRIWDQPNDPNSGEGAMKGQMLAKPVKVLSVRRVAP
jgi:peptidyl-prolyl cis-trans isomerase A (cyclophilin A)